MKTFFKNFRVGLVMGIVIVVASLVVWFGYNQWKLPAFMKIKQSHASVGVLKEASKEQLVIFGNHMDDDYPNVIDYANRQDLIVIIQPNTKLVKYVLYIPETLENLTKNRIKLDPTKIKKEKLTGSIDELGNLKGASVKIKTKNNTIKKTTFEATEVEYNVFVYPE